MIRKDLTGKKIGRLTVLRLSDIVCKNKKIKYICLYHKENERIDLVIFLNGKDMFVSKLMFEPLSL